MKEQNMNLLNLFRGTNLEWAQAPDIPNPAPFTKRPYKVSIGSLANQLRATTMSKTFFSSTHETKLQLRWKDYKSGVLVKFYAESVVFKGVSTRGPLEYRKISLFMKFSNKLIWQINGIIFYLCFKLSFVM